ncbi:MAG: hypothetical protein ACTSP9_03255 [Promethearchaeota archaeon]
MADLGAIMIELILYLIALLIIAIFMKIALGFFSKAKHTEFGQVFLTTFLMMLILFLFDWFLPGMIGLIIALVLIWLLISARHHTGFFGAILITIIAIILYVVVAIILGILFGVTLLILF